jgi:hypothetical protein
MIKNIIILLFLIVQNIVLANKSDSTSKHLIFLSANLGGNTSDLSTHLGGDINYVRNKLFIQVRANIVGLGYSKFGFLIGKSVDLKYILVNFGAGIAKLRYQEFCILGLCADPWERWSLPLTVDAIIRGKYAGFGLQLIGNIL